MKNHRKWFTICAYFKDIPINQELIDVINSHLKMGDNILIMIKKEENSTNDLQKMKFNNICELYPNETKTGQIIISAVPDIIEFKNYEL